MIETSPPGPAHVRPDAIKDLPLLLVLVETVIEKEAQEPAALRDAKPDGAPDMLVWVAKRIRALSAVLQQREEVAHGRRTETHDGRVLRLVHHVIKLPRLESRVHFDIRAAELPLIARDHLARTLAPFTHRKLDRGIVRADHRIRLVAAVGKRMPSLAFTKREAFTLSGVVYSQKESYCLINGLVLRVGEQIGGATVQKITPDEVVLDVSGRTLTIPVAKG